MLDEEKDYKSCQIKASLNMNTEDFFRRQKTDFYHRNRRDNRREDRDARDAKIIEIAEIERDYFSVTVEENVTKMIKNEIEKLFKKRKNIKKKTTSNINNQTTTEDKIVRTTYHMGFIEGAFYTTSWFWIHKIVRK